MPFSRKTAPLRTTRKRGESGDKDTNLLSFEVDVLCLLVLYVYVFCVYVFRCVFVFDLLLLGFKEPRRGRREKAGARGLFFCVLNSLAGHIGRDLLQVGVQVHGVVADGMMVIMMALRLRIIQAKAIGAAAFPATAVAAEGRVVVALLLVAIMAVMVLLLLVRDRRAVVLVSTTATAAGAIVPVIGAIDARGRLAPGIIRLVVTMTGKAVVVVGARIDDARVKSIATAELVVTRLTEQTRIIGTAAVVT